MFPVSHSPSTFVGQAPESLNDSPATHKGEEPGEHALQAEVNTLRELVCDLLEENEHLRMRLRML